MFRGKLTSELFEQCLEAGLCKDHFKDVEGADGLVSYELQRKALLFCRLQILGPILFNKPFSSDKLQKLFAKSEDFSRRDAPEPDEEFMDNVLLLDAVVVFTLCHFCKICCSGALFMSSHKHLPGSPNKNFIAELLTKNLLDESDIRYLNPLLQENFTGYNEDILKFCYVATLLFVRNVTMNIKIKQALKQQEAELQSTSKESEKWAEIGSEAFKSQRFEEAVKAYSSAITFNPYSFHLLKNRSLACLRLKRYKDAELDSYVILMINPTCCGAFCSLGSSMFSHQQYLLCKNAANYGLKKCLQTDPNYDKLKKLHSMADFRCQQIAKMKLEARTRSKLETSKKKDIPELIEASESDDESVGVPDLMEASNSEQSDSESESPDTSESNSPSKDASLSANQKSPSPETFKAVHSTSQNRERSESAKSSTNSIAVLQNSVSGKSNDPPKKLEVDPEERKKQLQSILQAASQSLLNGCSSVSAQQFRDALEEIKNYPLIYKYDEHNIMCIEYALGMVHYKLGEYEDFKKALAIFKGITENYVSLPLGFYGSGLVYMKLNRFKQALEFFKEVKSVLNEVQGKERDYEPYCWPGLTTLIEETKPGILKLRVEELLKECENPPLPDATCRFENCSLHSEIYLTDPDFKGYFSVQCSDQCGLQYHPLCWKTMKNKNQLTDKDFLEQKCLTPDCEGILIKVQCTGKDGAVNKEFSVPDPKKGTKLKKTKLGKKLEVKEEKKRRRKDSSSKTDPQSESNVDILSENPIELEAQSLIENINIPNIEDKENVECAEEPDVPTVPAKTEPFIVLKKEKFANEITSKSTKVKEHKKAKNTISIDEFLQRSDGPAQTGNSNVYQQRLNTLRQNNQTIVDGRWKSNISSGVVPSLPIIPTPNYTTDNYFSPPPSFYKNDMEPEETHEDKESDQRPLESASAFSEPAVKVEECIRKNLYSYLTDILGQRGPLKVDDPFLINELKNFPAEANIMIADCGGIGEFLQQNIDFAFVGEQPGEQYVCLVHQLPDAYSKILNTPLHESTINLFDSYEDDTNSQLHKHSYLNPDAKEYQPSEKIPRNSPQLISAVSRLRRPLAVDCEQGHEVKSNASSVTDLTKNQENYESESPVSNDSSICLSFEREKSPDSVKMELVRQCTEAVKVYHSVQADECRPYIDLCLKPYAIVELPKRISKSIQTENAHKMVSKGTLKTDGELERVKEVVTSLSDEKFLLVTKNKQLEEQYQLSQDSLTQLQNKSTTEQSYMKLQHDDAKCTYEREKMLFKTKETAFEKKIKQLTDQLNKSKDENSVCQAEVKELRTRNNNLKTNSELIEEKNKLLKEREKSMKDIIKNEMDEMIQLVEGLQAKLVNSTERAKDAELLLLQLKKTECLQRIDAKTAEASKQMKEIREGMPLVAANPLFTKNLEALLPQIQSYITKLGAQRIDFVVRIDDQINAINNGTPLRDLSPIEMKALPDIPSLASQFRLPDFSQSSQTSLASQVQMMNTALNSLQLPSFAYPTINNNQMATPPPISQVVPPTASLAVKPPKPENESVKPVKKLPPGLQDPLQPLAASSTSINSQPTVKPQVPDVKPKQPKPKAKSPVSMSRESLLSNASEVFKKSTSSYNASGLELGYKPGKAAAPNVPPVALNVTASAKPTGAEPKNSFQKLLTKLQTQFPSYTNKQLMDLVKEVRDKKNGLSGLAIDNIINEVTAIIEAKMHAEKAAENFAKYRLTQSRALVNKNLVSKEATPVVENTASKKCPWNTTSDSASKPWTGNEIEEECSICCEEMPKRTAYKVDCGHFFHFKCIKAWLSNKSDCPICRVHLLLPEDYPALA